MSIREERKRQSHQAIIDSVLRLCTKGRAFNSITLREISREIGLVPSAFYRHFPDMDALGLELIDKISLHFKSIIHQLGQTYLFGNNPNIDESLALFFNAVEHHQEEWIFIISERWGGSSLIRQAVDREIQYLVEDLAIHLSRIPNIEHMKDKNEIQMLADLIINLSFHWAITWINHLQQFENNTLLESQKQLKLQASTQLLMIFKGIYNWKSPTSDK